MLEFVEWWRAEGVNFYFLSLIYRVYQRVETLILILGSGRPRSLSPSGPPLLLDTVLDGRVYGRAPTFNSEFG